MAHEPAKGVVVEDWSELRDGNAALAGTDTHRKLVAEVAGERFAHAGKTHMLSQQSRDFKVKLIERDDAVDSVFASEVADGVEHLDRSEVFRHGNEF